MICDHPDCTGVHTAKKVQGGTALCPRVREQLSKRRRERYASDTEYRGRVLASNGDRYANNEVFRERVKERARQWYAEHKSDEDYRQRHQERSRRHYLERLRPSYVYAILANEEALKIGYSTRPYQGQENQTKTAFTRRGFGPRPEARMIWHNRGDQSLETYLQWRAGRLWTPLVKGHRHSEWFDISGVPVSTIVKNLRRWRSQAELPDEEEVA